MPHETINPNGTIFYRTELIRNFVQARNTLKMFSANPRFCECVLCPSETAKTPSWYVQFRPSNPERQLDMLERQQAQRQNRAEQEALDYIYWPVPDDPGTFYCFNPKSGKTYEVGPFHCNCPDYEFRCEKSGLQCKHQIGLEVQALSGGRK